MQIRAPYRYRRDDTGVSLIIALVLILAIGLVLVALTSATASDIRNSTNLSSLRSVEYAADGATSIAVQSVRFSGNSYYPAASAGDCLPNSSPVTVDGVSMQVACVGLQAADQFSGVTRSVDFYACGSTQPQPCTASNSVLQAQVDFDDVSESNQWFCTPGGRTSTCGAGITIISWIVETANS